jgi:hypothetical protein
LYLSLPKSSRNLSLTVSFKGGDALKAALSPERRYEEVKAQLGEAGWAGVSHQNKACMRERDIQRDRGDQVPGE